MQASKRKSSEQQLTMDKPDSTAQKLTLTKQKSKENIKLPTKNESTEVKADKQSQKLEKQKSTQSNKADKKDKKDKSQKKEILKKKIKKVKQNADHKHGEKKEAGYGLNAVHNFKKFEKQLLKESDFKPKYHHGFATKAIHVAQDPEKVFGSVITPIHLTTTYAQHAPGKPYNIYDYSRCGNPTREVLDKIIASLEYANYGMTFSSGCSVLACIVMLLQTGDHILCCDDVYGGTQRYLKQIVEVNTKISIDFVDMTKLDEVEKKIKKNTKLMWIETPTNPTLKICDIQKVCEIAKKNKILTAVDNTFATPVLQSPLQLGADISVNSCTKYIGGHCDLLLGALTTNSKELRDKLFFAQKSFGGVSSPFDCYLAIRGIKTLRLRVEEHTKNAGIIAKFLEGHKYVNKVFYPGLESHPQHEIAKKQMRGFGGMISFSLKGGAREASLFCQKTQLFTLAESLGGVESLCEIPAQMTHMSVPAERRKELGIDDGLIRLSVGIESIEDLLQDIDHALNLACGSGQQKDKTKDSVEKTPKKKPVVKIVKTIAKKKQINLNKKLIKPSQYKKKKEMSKNKK